MKKILIFLLIVLCTMVIVPVRSSSPSGLEAKDTITYYGWRYGMVCVCPMPWAQCACVIPIPKK